MIVKQVGKVAALRKLIDEQKVDFGKTFISHCAMVSNLQKERKPSAITNMSTELLNFPSRLILVGLPTVNLHLSTLTLTVPIPLVSSPLSTTVSLPTIRNSRLSWRRTAITLRVKLTPSVLPSSPNISTIEKSQTVT